MSNLSEATPLLLVLCLAVLAPVIANYTRKPKLPIVAVEVLLGILAGPHVLKWVEPSPALMSLSRFGIAFLFFWIGYELDLKRIWGETLQRAFKAWLISLAIGVGVGLILVRLDMVASSLMVGIALTTSALGILIPILRDNHDLDTAFGDSAVAMAAVGELGPIVLVSILAISQGNPNPLDISLLIVFLAAIAGVTYLATRISTPAMLDMLKEQLETTAQLPIRIAALFLAALFFISAEFGLDAILGALAAGLVVGLLSNNDTGHEVRKRFESIGFGLFIPIFFITTGVHFDLSGLLASTTALSRVPLFLILFLIVRGVPTYLYKDILNKEDRIALAYSSATTLPVLIALTDVGLNSGIMRSETAAGLIGAGTLSVIIYPYLMLKTRTEAGA